MLINQSRRFMASKFRQVITIKSFIDEYETEFTEEEAVAIVIPLSPQEIERLPEGERSHNSIKIFTLNPLKKGDRALVKVKVNNAVEIKEFRVLIANNWGDYGYYNNVAVELASTQKNNSTGFVIT